MDPWQSQQDTARIPHAISPSYYSSTEQAHGAGHMDTDFRQLQHGYIRNDYSHNLHQHHPHSHPQDAHEAIQREIEKERIREEIIMSEIIRRRVLEEEVRRELMTEREMAMRRGSDGFPYVSPPVMGLESPMRPSLLGTRAEGWAAEEKLGMALEDKEKQKGKHEDKGLDAWPFQRTADLRISEVKPASEGNKDEEIILLLTKQNENVSGSNRKAVTPPDELSADIIANKKSKEEWACALCRVSASSKKTLEEHLLGEKHQAKEAAFRARRGGKNYRIGLFPKKANKSNRIVRTIDPREEEGVKHKAQSLLSEKAGEATSKKDDLPLLENPKSELSKKTQSEVIQKVQKNNDASPFQRTADLNISEVKPASEGNKDKERILLTKPDENVSGSNKKSKEWRCALCQVSASSEKNLEEHLLGKKHQAEMDALRARRGGKNFSIGPFPNKATSSYHIVGTIDPGEEEGVKHKARSLLSEKAREATSKKDDLPLLENPKSEHLKKTQSEVIQKVQKNKDASPLQRTADLRISEVKPASEGNKDKTKPDENVSGSNKKSKEWRCALCQVSASSEKTLEEHLLGKKHQAEMDALRARRGGKNCSIGPFPNKATKSYLIVGTSDPGEEEGVKHKARSLLSEEAREVTSKKDDLPLLENPKSEHLKKTQSEVIQKVQKNKDASLLQRTADLRISEVKPASEGNKDKTKPDENVSGSNKKSKEWRCALCQVSASSEKTLEEHLLGKKHQAEMDALRARRGGKNCSIGPFPNKATKSYLIVGTSDPGEEEGVKHKARSLLSEEAREATSKKDDLPLLENPKSEYLKKTQSEVIQKVQKNKDASPLQRTADLRISEVKPASDGNKDKTKSDENVSGSNRKAVTPPEALSADIIANKKSIEWVCALCQVSATSKKALEEHLLGEKHQAEMAALSALRGGENYSVRLFPNKTTKSNLVFGTIDPWEEEGVKHKAQSLLSEKAGEAASKKDDLPLLGNRKSEHLKKTQSEVIQNVQKNEDDPNGKETSQPIEKFGTKLWNWLSQPKKSAAFAKEEASENGKNINSET